MVLAPWMGMLQLCPFPMRSRKALCNFGDCPRSNVRSSRMRLKSCEGNFPPFPDVAKILSSARSHMTVHLTNQPHRPVSDNVRRRPATISSNVRQKWALIARRAVHHCASLHLAGVQHRWRLPWRVCVVEDDPGMVMLRRLGIFAPLEPANAPRQHDDGGEGGDGHHLGRPLSSDPL